MAPKKASSRPTVSRPLQLVHEWVVTPIPVSLPVTDEGHSVVVVMVLDLLHKEVLTAQPTHPGKPAMQQMPGLIKALFQEHGRTPTRISTASAPVAKALQAVAPRCEIVCRPTPETDDMVQSFQQHVLSGLTSMPERTAQEDEAMRAMFKAAVPFYKLRPWKIVPGDHCLLELSIPELGVSSLITAVLGRLGQSYALLAFDDIIDQNRYLLEAMAACTDMQEQALQLPTHRLIDFESVADLCVATQKELTQKKWPLASRDAYPDLSVLDGEKKEKRDGGPQDAHLFEIILQTYSSLLRQHKKAVLRAWNEDEPFSAPFTIETHLGVFAVHVTTCLPSGRTGGLPPQDASADLASIALGPHDVQAWAQHARQYALPEKARFALHQCVLKQFQRSKDGKRAKAAAAAALLCDTASARTEQTVFSLTPASLDQMIYEDLPRRAMMQPNEARPFLHSLSRFYEFLAREFGLPKVEARLRVLTRPLAAERLEVALADSRGFSPIKQMMMQGMQAGFDPSTAEGIEALVEAWNSGQIQAQPGFDFEPPTIDEHSMFDEPTPRAKKATNAGKRGSNKTPAVRKKRASKKSR